MNTFKSDVYEICKEIASEFPGWSFASGEFKNKVLKHSELIVHPGFGFGHGTTSLIPSLAVQNKRISKLMKNIVGYEQPASLVSFQAITNLLSFMPEQFRSTAWIVANRSEFCAAGPTHEEADNILDVAQARPILRNMLQDGIDFFNKNYDLTNEDALLRSLPVKYPTQHQNSPYDQMDRQKGVALCIAHILLGDFDFLEKYMSDEFETVYPKRMVDLEKIILVLPELKKLFEEGKAKN